MDRETIKYILTANASRPLPAAAPRTLQLPLDVAKVITLVGIRRSGKTYILYETMRRLEAQGVDPRRTIYLNFEDDRLLPIKTRELDLILRAHEELHPDVTGQKKYLFFDEVPNAPRWETFVRRLHDNENVQIFVTGSSSHLLTRERRALRRATGNVGARDRGAGMGCGEGTTGRHRGRRRVAVFASGHDVGFHCARALRSRNRQLHITSKTVLARSLVVQDALTDVVS